MIKYRVYIKATNKLIYEFSVNNNKEAIKHFKEISKFCNVKFKDFKLIRVKV